MALSRRDLLKGLALALALPLTARHTPIPWLGTNMVLRRTGPDRWDVIAEGKVAGWASGVKFSGGQVLSAHTLTIIDGHVRICGNVTLSILSLPASPFFQTRTTVRV